MRPRFVESDRLAAVQSPIIPVVGELIRAHPGTISLGQGVVHYGPPTSIMDRVAACVAMPDVHKYKLVQGVPELLDVIRGKLASDNDIRVDDSSRIIVTAGGNMGFMNAVLAVADPGDEIIIQSPYYFNHEMAIAIADCRAVVVPTDATYQLDARAIEAAITDRTRAIVTVSPNNPSGAVYDEASLRRVNELCRERGLYHISDEAYEYFTYDRVRHFSPGSIDGGAGHTISLYSLSKSFGFASWRIGYMVLPAQLETAVKKIQDTILICPPVVCQHAAVAAMEAGRAYCEPLIEGIGEVRNLVLDALAKLAPVVEVPRPQGAFYALLRLDTRLRDMEIVERLVREFGVAVIPGCTFGIDGACQLRVAYGALAKDTVAEGVGRLVRGLRAILRVS